ncbi:MAG: lytic transglycosylase domain-containing protein [Oscillospiraceae bacterium]|jgi:soluble lytic murein transglycosylase|nr:lytic transglycosylase domain-containing protein [Oscillospiraceae bacterium]
MRTKRKKRPLFAIIITALIIAICLIAAKTAYDYLHRQWLLRTHPLEFAEYVELHAREYDLDKFFVYAVIKTESDFKPDAESNMGARGLMQIMEDTFDWLSGYRLFERDMTFDDMFSANENIRFGCYLLAYHLENFGDIDCVLAAYFAGDRTVIRWLENPELSSDGKTLDHVPDPDTRHYIHKVNTAYEIYIKLYS